MGDKRSAFQSFKRVVVKVGTSSVAYDTGKPNLYRIESLVRQISDIHNLGKEVILVTSGAIGTGAGKLGLPGRPKTIPEKQAAAAVGQGVLMHIYEKIFAEYGVTVGQVLLTREDFADRRRFLNARNAMHALLQYGVIPIINENDTVAVDEIKLGDNDNLSALVASLIDAEMLILLSDIDGLFTADPRKNPDACLIKEVREITPEIEALAGGSGRLGTGGMTTKLQAAKIAMHSGVVTVLANLKEKDVVRNILSGEPAGTVFWPCANKMDNKKRWIAFNSSVCGRLHVDEGAARALLKNGKSLLPSGITRVEGNFEMGNTVSIADPDGREIAKGIVYYSSVEINLIKGEQSRDIPRIIGHKDYDEVVHRNNLVLEL
ncbi:MAG: glutamate 5-kinase [Pelotomaculaceae bacterium]|jgi:glutamate 5-kinase|uniref:Glutamate 5-kinase n=1 Tax=anaerobic digester metagenome TaxID=1263854 RepID=A0A485M1X0_9ZZZZ|nr:glutamate 5-kinase [Bacillota bacterium]HHU86214.1 glutamate 5-kinase [Peptococcaceae bacterium]